MRVIIGGGTGFIGQALASALKARGDEVLLLSRTRAPGQLNWDMIRSEGLPSCDAVVNLAGKNLMQKRWNQQVKREIFSSRIDTSQLLAQAIRESSTPPSVFITASGISYYCLGGPHDEQGPPGEDFLSLLAAAWENASALPAGVPTRQVTIRIGVVLGTEGGALGRMLPLFRLGLGGSLGSGKQPFCWIHLDDLIALFLFAMDNPVAGIFNGVSPHPVTMHQFAKTLGKALGKPARLPIPGWLIKFLLGERARVILASPCVIPKRGLNQGFHYTYPTLEEALAHLIG